MAFLALIVQLVFGITIPEEVINEIVLTMSNVVAVGVVLYGIVKNHQKPTPMQNDKSQKEIPK